MYKGGTLNKERYDLAMTAKDFFMAFYNCSCKHVCIENPAPLKVCGLPQETQRIQPYEFGERYSKLTYLWLKGLPCLMPTKICAEHETWVASNTGAFSKGLGNGSHGVAKTQKQRSKTFMGVADAFAEQFGNYILGL